MASRLLLIRHGETTWNREGRWQGHADSPLSEVGRDQARRLAETARSWSSDLSAIYTSDLVRARETAGTVANALGMQPIEDPALREMDVGRWSGFARDEIRERFAPEWTRISAGEDLPRGGGETMAAFADRVGRALDAIVARHARGSVAVVTHGGVIRVALLRVLGLASTELRRVAPIANTEIIEIDTRASPWKMRGERARALDAE